MNSITAVLLAAGESTRMGKLKSLLIWGKYSLIEYQIRSLLNSNIEEIVVVLGYRNKELMSSIDKFPINFVVNNDYVYGKTTSIKKGISCASNNKSDFLFLSVDQPRETELINNIIDFHFKQNSLISYPVYKKHGGHPIIFNRSLKFDIENIDERTFGLKNIINKYKQKVSRLEVSDGQCLLDLNTYDDYEKAHKQYFKD